MNPIRQSPGIVPASSPVRSAPNHSDGNATIVPIANLRAEPSALGLTVVSKQRAERHNGQDVVTAAVLPINAALIGGEDLAWRPAPPSRARALLRTIAFNASVPVLALAYLVDRTIS
ncbi:MULTISPECIES: hypothetical protein [unclassified Pseudofrankia]|uniref:hypothetical protein n=1 Tax=unclassified Pseudofrankia TaxID=2994372 RepID=UPI0010422B9F|nr:MULTISPECIES: hypothetical protein [unclassified Pseudofrankia]MDT3445076.1 hypothetical protein [Pseudofrankia sp. BMG5.37]